jgi:hypothetical protein
MYSVTFIVEYWKLQRQEGMRYQEIVRKRTEDLERQERKLIEEEAQARRIAGKKKEDESVQLALQERRLIQEQAGAKVAAGKQSQTDEFQQLKICELPPQISIHSGSMGSNGFVDGVLAHEARFSSPSGIALLNGGLIVSDTGE